METNQNVDGLDGLPLDMWMGSQQHQQPQMSAVTRSDFHSSGYPHMAEPHQARDYLIQRNTLPPPSSGKAVSSSSSSSLAMNFKIFYIIFTALCDESLKQFARTECGTQNKLNMYRTWHHVPHELILPLCFWVMFTNILYEFSLHPCSNHLPYATTRHKNSLLLMWAGFTLNNR